MEKQLVEVRCPFKNKSKHNNKIYLCNNLCVKVYPPSSGETYCTVCKLVFEFEVGKQSQSSTKIVVKSIK